MYRTDFIIRALKLLIVIGVGAALLFSIFVPNWWVRISVTNNTGITNHALIHLGRHVIWDKPISPPWFLAYYQSHYDSPQNPIVYIDVLQLVIESVTALAVGGIFIVMVNRILRTVRRRKGYCPSCGYNLCGTIKLTATCPECGYAPHQNVGDQLIHTEPSDDSQ